MHWIKRIAAHIIANAGALYAIGLLMDGDFSVLGGWKGYLIAAILFGFLNGVVKPILKILSLPFVIVTAGLFIFIINTALVYFAEYALDVLKFENVSIVVQGGFFNYLLAGFLVSIFNMIIHWLLKK
jgi:putative membrane protein